MLRPAFLVLTLSVVVGIPANAGPISFGSSPSPYGPLYSPSSSPFEAFEWTPLDFAAFSAYGGDFANVRRPVKPVLIFEDPVLPAVEPGLDDEQASLRLAVTPHFEASAMSLSFDESLHADPIPEPGALLLVGLGMLGASARLRRAYRR